MPPQRTRAPASPPGPPPSSTCARVFSSPVLVGDSRPSTYTVARTLTTLSRSAQPQMDQSLKNRPQYVEKQAWSQTSLDVANACPERAAGNGDATCFS